MNRALALPAVAISVACAFPAAAGAVRPATPDEHASIAATVEQDPTCVTVLLSTAPGLGAEYGRVESTNADGCPIADGFTTVDNAATKPGYWLQGYSANDDDLPPCEQYGVPPAAGVDLNICDPRPAKTYASYFGGLEYRPRSLPQGAHGGYQNVRWSSWDRTRAVGRGVLRYEDRDLKLRVPVRITLYRVRFCPTGERAFTRRRVVAVRQRDRKAIRFATRARAFGDCTIKGR
ncbi:hypothetical protein [Patulibacter sp. SYSU D01012]|uniref:hypothetical protein n=1 Tax=Patulibacter sp. SYSU D01012 TaxID=2817381 RepID=UPI001B30E931|nr:hypothetical protein [Patulibacter sp. SYSU D01012]